MKSENGNQTRKNSIKSSPKSKFKQQLEGSTRMRVMAAVAF